MPTAGGEAGDPDPTIEVDKAMHEHSMDNTEADDEPDDAAPEAKRQRMSIFLKNLPELQTCVARTIAYGALDDKQYGIRGAIGAPSDEPRGEIPGGLQYRQD